MTVWISVHCPNCYATDIIKHGKSLKDKQRYLCQNSNCLRRTFILDYSYLGQTRTVNQQMVEMSLNSSGIRDIDRVLQVGAPTVIRELKKKKSHLKSVNQKVFENLLSKQVKVEIYQVEEAEETANSGVEESELDAPVELCGEEDKSAFAGYGTKTDRSTVQNEFS